MRKPLTERQSEVLDQIKGYIERNGYPPTHEELSLLIGCRSTKAAQDHIKAIEKKGYIKITPEASRGIKVLGKKKTINEIKVDTVKKAFQELREASTALIHPHLNGVEAVILHRLKS